MRIAFLGDSLTEGWPGAAFFPLLEERYPHHELVNLGRAGDSVADLLRRLPHEDPGPVDLVVLWIGANDAVADAATHDGAGEWSWEARVRRAVADYGELLVWAAGRAPRTVCIRPVVLEAEGSLWESHFDELGDALEGRARTQAGARVLDLRPAFAAAAVAGRGPFTIDGVHFTEQGAAVVAGAIAAQIALAETEHGAVAEHGRPTHTGARTSDPAGPAQAGQEET
jgi:lysophospholipase L1-like esterase